MRGSNGVRRSFVIAGGAALALAPQIVRAQSATPLRVAHSPSGWTLGLGYIAQQGGFFAQNGLAVDLTSLTNGGAISAAVIGGAVEIGITNVGSAANALSRGLPLALVAPGSVSRAGSKPLTAVAVLDGSPVRTARDLAGKTICVSTLRDTQHASVMNWLERNGCDPKSVSFVEVPVPQSLNTLRAKRVDAAALAEPWIADGGNDVRVLGAPYDTLGPEVMISGWIATRSWIAANPATLQKFRAAIAASSRWANANPQAALGMVEEMSKIPHELAVKMGRPVLGDRIVVAQVQPIIDVTAKYGFLPKAYPASDLIAPT